MKDHLRQHGVAYLAAIAATAAMVLLRWLLDPWLGYYLPFVTLYGAIAAAVWYGGYRPALVATVLGYVAVNYLFMEPRGSFALLYAHHYIGLALYLFTCSLIIGSGEAMRLAHRRTEQGQELLRVTFASMGDAVITTDAESRVTTLNQVAVVLTGWKQEEAAGRPLEEVFRIVNEQTRQPVENPVVKVLAEGKVVGLANHTVLIAKDGTERPINDSAAPIRDAGGGLRGVVLIFRDITERRKAEAAKNQLAVIVESSEDAIYSKDVNGNITSWNQGAERLYDYTAEEVIGKPVSLLIPPDLPDELPEIMERLRRGERIERYETVRLCKDGRRVEVSLSVSPLKNGSGKMLGASLIAQDISARKQAEEELRQSEERTRSVVNNVLDGIITIDERGVVQSFNPAAERLFGYSASEVIGHNVKLLMPEPYHSEHDGYLANYCRTGQAKIIGIGREVAGRRKDGSTFPMDLAVSEFRLGERRYFTGIVRDITERKFVEGKLQRERERLDLALSAGRMGVYEWNPIERVAWWSPEVYAIHGVRPESFNPADGVKLVHPDDLEKAMDIPLAIEQHRPWVQEYRMIRPDGEVRWVAGRGETEYDKEGRGRRFHGVLMDITERKRIEEALRFSEQRARAFLENSAIIAWLKDEQGRNIFLSENYVRRFGLENWKDKSDFELWPHDIAEEYRRNDLVVLSRDRPFECIEEARTADGEVSYWLNSKFWFQDASGRKYVGGVGVDITERRRAEEALKDADRRKDEFLALLAHELRNPLAPLRNAIELLRRADGNAALIGQSSRIMERQVGQMVRLVDDLLDISRIARGKVQLRKERVELAAVVRSAVEAARPLIEAQAHELTLTPPQEPVYLDGDPTRLAQVFSNLLTNAAKYTEKGGHVWLCAERQGGGVVVSVRDTGIGIAADYLPHLFEMFSQAASALERSQGGLGIGLSLVRGLVELHGGTVEARSGGPGLGSEFIVRLPVVEAPVETAQEPSGDGEKIGGGRKCRILVVDDNGDAADSLAMMLRLKGHDIHTAFDGLEAIQAAAAFRPEVVLLDIGLPKMNGYYAARHIREQSWGGHMALIALTGWGQEEDKRRSLEAGFDHHLTKPVDPAALEKLLALIVPMR